MKKNFKQFWWITFSFLLLTTFSIKLSCTTSNIPSEASIIKSPLYTWNSLISESAAISLFNLNKIKFTCIKIFYLFNLYKININCSLTKLIPEWFELLTYNCLGLLPAIVASDLWTIRLFLISLKPESPMFNACITFVCLFNDRRHNVPLPIF